VLGPRQRGSRSAAVGPARIEIRGGLGYRPRVDLRPGDALDVYRLVAELGEGGQGTVWHAVDAAGRDVALKLVDVATARPTDVERLRREAYALARLDHPSLVRCHRLFEDPRRAILGLVLDRVDGTPLDVVEHDPRFDRRRRLAVLRHLAGALRHLHAVGLAHRDVKAANVLVRRDFFTQPDEPTMLVLVDLGIAIEAGNPQPLTAPGGVIGTREFLAPELLAPHQFGPIGAGPERDVFAFGVLAMRLLVGRHPSGLGPSATLAEMGAAYLAFAASGVAFPVGVDGEPEAILFRRTLALRAADRVPDGAALCALLEPTVADRTELAPPSPRPDPPSPTWPDAPAPVVPPAPARRSTGMPLTALAVLGVAALVAVAFVLGTLVASPSAPASGASSIPRPPTSAPVRPVAVSPTPIAPARPAITTPPVTLPTCPPGAVAVRASGGACVDATPVSVRDFLASGGRLEGTADWPGSLAAQRAEQTKGCRSARDGVLAVNCVDHAQAVDHCAKRGARLASADEWLAAMTAGAAPGGVPRGALHEWTRDPSPSGPGYFRTCAPSAVGCESGNPQGARNDDCGFRCAAQPR
jgi:serine/threonine-protein kinase